MTGVRGNIWRVSSAMGALLAAVLLAMPGMPLARAQGEEPTPIQIQLVVPEQIGPGSLMDVWVQYNLVDPNAGADLNYNVFGPCHVVGRDPEPPNPTVNTWAPGRGMAAKGTIQIRVQVDSGSDGQIIRHQVEVRWGTKSRTFAGQTRIVYVPPTATPTLTPRPRATPTRTASVPTAIPVPTLVLTEVIVLNANGDPVSSTEANQEIALRIAYSSTADIPDLGAAVRFEPDVVNVEGLQQGPEGYVVHGLVLPAGRGAGGVLDLPIKGRIRPYLEKESGYELRATVQLLPTAGMTVTLSGSPASAVVQVMQPLLVTVQASLETNAVKAGGSVIVHVTCQNHGLTSIGPVRFSLTSLPAGFDVSPAEQIIDRLAGKSSAEERLFTIHSPQGFEGPLSFRVVARAGETVIESPQMSAEALPPMHLTLEVSADKSTVQAGESLHLTVRIINPGKLEVEGITAKVVDAALSLGSPAQEVGNLPPGTSRDITFVVDVPQDLPGDMASSLVIQTVSRDGTISQSEPLTMPLVCRPRFEVLVQPLVGNLRSGQSVEVISLVRNTSQCTARDMFVTVESLPPGFALPAAQKLLELAPGGTRQMVFSLLVPPGFTGEGSLEVAVADGGGNRGRSQPTGMSVSGLPTTSIIIFGLLVLLAVTMVVGGVVLYFRQR